MTFDTGFVAAVLEGIEGTLAELMERVETSELKASLDVLQSRVTTLRVSIESHTSYVTAAEGHESEEPVEV